MTYRRAVGSVEEGVLVAIRELSPDEIKGFTGVSPQIIADAGNPVTSKTLSLEHAANLDAALTARGRPEVFAALFARLRDRKLQEKTGIPIHEPQDLRDRLVSLSAEAGDVAAEFRKRSEDGELSADDLQAICQQAREALAATEALIRDCEAIAAVKARPTLHLRSGNGRS